MFIPLHDANTLKHIKLQWVTLGLIAANIVVWLFTGVIASEQVSKATIRRSRLHSGCVPLTMPCSRRRWNSSRSR